MSASLEEEKIGNIIEKVKLDTSHRYEAKISKIEGRMQELISHNQALTSELAKWTVDDGMFEDDEMMLPGPEQADVNLYAIQGMRDLYWSDRSQSNVEDESSSLDESSRDTGSLGRKSSKSPTENSSTSAKAKSSFQASIPSTSNARARLQQVRDSLELVASKPILHSSRPGSTKYKATSLQKKARGKRRQKSTRKN